MQNTLIFSARDQQRTVHHLIGKLACPHLKGKVILPHGGLQKSKALHEAARLLLQHRKVVVDLLHQPDGRLIPVEVRIQLRTHLPAVQRNDQRLLHGVFLDFVFHRFFPQ